MTKKKECPSMNKGRKVSDLEFVLPSRKAISEWVKQFPSII